MKFDLNSPGIILLNQFKTSTSLENISHYWYVSSEGINHFKNNIGLLQNFDINLNDLLSLITKKYKYFFEFTFDKVDLGFFVNWTCLEIHIYSDKKRDHSSNIKNFLNHLNISFHFDMETQLYSIENFPHLKTQYDLFLFINDYISQDLNYLFKSQYVAQCSLGINDYSLFKNFENKIEFLEKSRLKIKLEQQFPLKENFSFKKI
jgi:hypothetical protein